MDPHSSFHPERGDDGEPLVLIDEEEAELTWSEASSERYTLAVDVTIGATIGAQCAPGAYLTIRGGVPSGPAGEALTLDVVALLPAMPWDLGQWELAEVPTEAQVVIPPTTPVLTYISERDDARDPRWRGWYGGTVTVVDWSATHATLEIGGTGLTACDSDACWPYGPITLALESLPGQQIPTGEHSCTEGGVPDPATGLCVRGESAPECSTLPW